MSPSRPENEHTRRFTVAVLLAIGTFDVVCGLRMLLGADPWLQNGLGAPWLALPDHVRAAVDHGPVALGLYRRIGALWLHAGLAMIAWSWWVRRDWRGRSLLIATCTLSGLGIAWCDDTFAAGTDWLLLKRAVGAVWTAMLVAHVVGRPHSVPDGAAR